MRPEDFTSAPTGATIEAPEAGIRYVKELNEVWLCIYSQNPELYSNVRCDSDDFSHVAHMFRLVDPVVLLSEAFDADI